MVKHMRREEGFQCSPAYFRLRSSCLPPRLKPAFQQKDKGVAAESFGRDSKKDGEGSFMANPAVDAEFQSCRQRLEDHWMRLAGNVCIPDSWGREKHLQEWAECSAVEDALRPPSLIAARDALIKEKLCQTGVVSGSLSELVKVDSS